VLSLNSAMINNGIKRIVLLGHSGFIGRHLEKALGELFADTQIIGKSLPVLDLTKKEGTQELSGLLDPQTAVIMCAAIKRQFGETLEAFEQNMAMTINLCRLFSRKPVKRFIFFSSAAVYGEDIHNTNITEKTPVCPRTYYGMAKYSAECLYQKTIGGKNKGSLAIIRPPLIYGPGDMGNTYGPVGFIKAVLERKPITLWGDGTELREFIFVEDIVRVVCGLLNNDFDGVVNVASGKSHTFKDLLKIISGLMQEELLVTSTQRTKDKADNIFDNTGLMRLMPAFRFTPLEQGVRKTFECERTGNIGQTIQGVR